MEGMNQERNWLIEIHPDHTTITTMREAPLNANVAATHKFTLQTIYEQ